MPTVHDAPKACRECGTSIHAARDANGRIVFVESVPAVLPGGLGELGENDGQLRFAALGRPLFRRHVCPATGEEAR